MNELTITACDQPHSLRPRNGMPVDRNSKTWQLDLQINFWKNNRLLTLLYSGYHPNRHKLVFCTIKSGLESVIAIVRENNERLKVNVDNCLFVFLSAEEIDFFHKELKADLKKLI